MPAVSCTCVKLAGAQNSCINDYIQRRHGVGHAAESTRLTTSPTTLTHRSSTHEHQHTHTLRL